MRGFFLIIVKKLFYSKSEAFVDFLISVRIFYDFSKPLSERLKEIMLSDKLMPWSGEKLNELSGDAKCNCVIRKAFTYSVVIIDCPSQ